MDPMIGQIIMFGGNFAPRGWALCDGQLLPVSQHQALFSILGTTYGGDGRTTFALPDLRGRVPIHPGTGTGLTQRRLGETGGSESTAHAKRHVKGTRDRGVRVAQDGATDNMQPFGAVNFIIALQGVFPSRN